MVVALNNIIQYPFNNSDSIMIIDSTSVTDELDNKKDSRLQLIPRDLMRATHQKILKGLSSPLSTLPMRRFKGIARLLHTSNSGSINTTPTDESLATTENSVHSSNMKSPKLQTKDIKIVTRRDLLENTYNLHYPAAGSNQPHSPESTSYDSHKSNGLKRRHTTKPTTARRSVLKSQSLPNSPTESSIKIKDFSTISSQIVDLDLNSNEIYRPTREPVNRKNNYPSNTLGGNGDFLSIPIHPTQTRDSKLSDTSRYCSS